jgi:hypothetical protein
MKVLQEIALPQSESFYTQSLVFDVKLDTSACGTFSLKDGTQFTLDGPSLLASVLTSANGTRHRANLESISLAALRFLRDGKVKQFAPAEYASLIFLTRYYWGLAFRQTAKGSLRHAPASSATLHSEALRTHTEQFAYGLAVDFVSSLLGIPIDRFFFIPPGGARPDFRARVSAAELSANGIAALSPSGHVVRLEVKARTGWASYRRNGGDGLDLLHDLSKKAGAKANCVFLSVVVSVPDKHQKRARHARIILADPGDPTALGTDDQVVLLLEEALHQLVRHGLWPTLSSALDWLRLVRGKLTEGEESLLRYTEGHRDQLQYDLLSERRGDRVFNGRIFSDVVLRLGHPGERIMTRNEAEQRLAQGDFGRAWYSGADKAWIDAVQAHDAEGFLNYGLRQPSGGAPIGKSAFILEEEPMTDDVRNAIRNALEAALRRWHGREV